MKIRLSRELHRRASACAAAVYEPLGRYVRICCSLDAKGTFAGVATDAALMSATRADSVPITVPIEGKQAAEIRAALVRGVLYAEARNPPRFETHLKAGVDYIIGKGF